MASLVVRLHRQGQHQPRSVFQAKRPYAHPAVVTVLELSPPPARRRERPAPRRTSSSLQPALHMVDAIRTRGHVARRGSGWGTAVDAPAVRPRRRPRRRRAGVIVVVRLGFSARASSARRIATSSAIDPRYFEPGACVEYPLSSGDRHLPVSSMPATAAPRGIETPLPGKSSERTWSKGREAYVRNVEAEGSSPFASTKSHTRDSVHELRAISGG